MAMRNLGIPTATALPQFHGTRRTLAEIAARQVWWPRAAQDITTALESIDRQKTLRPLVGMRPA